MWVQRQTSNKYNVHIREKKERKFTWKGHTNAKIPSMSRWEKKTELVILLMLLGSLLNVFLKTSKTSTAKTPPFPVTGHIHKECMCSERIQKKRLKNMLVTQKFRNHELYHYEFSGGRAGLTLTSLTSLHRFFLFSLPAVLKISAFKILLCCASTTVQPQKQSKNWSGWKIT